MHNQELRIEILLEEVVKKRASDLHIQVGLPPMLRIDGARSEEHTSELQSRI